MKSTRYYDQHSVRLAREYQARDPWVIHDAWHATLAGLSPGLACDIGAGVGRDAGWLAEQGWEVIAVEPSAPMRAAGQAHTAGKSVTWLEDALPDLTRLRNVGYRFDLILVAAVWQHIAPGERARTLRVLANLLKPGGYLVISLRLGSDDDENRARGFHPVSGTELATVARGLALQTTHVDTRADQTREHLHWDTHVFQLPDDGSGNLALLRHIIVNDDKSSSYKLALLRALGRIAETQPGAVLERDETTVAVPLGLVALYWLKQYKPLILTHGLPVGAAKGIGFATEDFYRLSDFSDYDLHVGGRFDAPRGTVLTRALRDACATITRMPARHITWPGQNRQIFEVQRRAVRAKNTPVLLDLRYLSTFGRLRVPIGLWQTLGSYACWIEPVILREWAALTGRWQISDYRAPEPSLFAWESQQRFTGIARQRVDTLRGAGVPVPCAWSGKNAALLDIDHCFPWSRWQNNDLWNLLPATPAINRAKSDRLATNRTLQHARHRVIRWWQNAYIDSALEERFLSEATLALPNLDSRMLSQDCDALFEAMLHQRARLKSDQQLADWDLL